MRERERERERENSLGLYMNSRVPEGFVKELVKLCQVMKWFWSWA